MTAKKPGSIFLRRKPRSTMDPAARERTTQNTAKALEWQIPECRAELEEAERRRAKACNESEAYAIDDRIEELKNTLNMLLAAEARIRPAMTEMEIRESALQIIKGFKNARSVAVWNLYALGQPQRKIASELKCSVGTVNAVLRELEDAGLLGIRKTGGAHPEAMQKGGKARVTTNRD
jgi:transcription initiation factor IIE alpha subunit